MCAIINYGYKLCACTCVVSIYRINVYLALCARGYSIILYIYTHVCMYVWGLLGVYEPHWIYMYAFFYVCAISYMSTCYSMPLCTCEAMIV